MDSGAAASTAFEAPRRARRSLRVRGTVQGVGFRPSVYRLALASALCGFVRNDSEGVWIEIEGDPRAVGAFPELLRREAPPLSRIDGIEIEEIDVRGDAGFHVAPSEGRPDVRARVPADSATCEACLSELFDPADRRYRYPFINCTDCGPRYTIVRDVPYDRDRTTMDGFVLCALCRDEYEDPASRRFHAEPNACPECGPRLELHDEGVSARGGRARSRPRDDDALRGAAARIASGGIVAIKGLGGFLLAVDAGNEEAVARLRQRKGRPDKPFAVMARDLETAERIAAIAPAARDALASAARPIVLVPKRAGAAPWVAPSVAPRLAEIGVMLPYAPLHHLLIAEGPAVLVMTSGNRSEEPIARDNDAALSRLAGIADAFLLHDREIHARADDSVVRIVGGAAQPVRRSRGYVPEPIALDRAPGAEDAPVVLAVGAELKNTICMTRGDEAFLSPHVGDLGNPEAFAFFEEAAARLARLLEAAPAIVAHDLHPDYASTRWALASGLPREPVQHHHAHIASCLAEHAETGPVIGVAFDGTGCGPAGDLWGGEILLADLAQFRRLGHLRPIALPGGEAAIREPWRLAVAALLDAERPDGLDLLARIEPRRLDLVRRLIEIRFAAPLATGAGRWFDAVSALCGVRDTIGYEGQAAIELEAAALAADGDAPGAYPFVLSRDAPFQADLRPTVGAIVDDRRAGAPVGLVASRFHSTLARVILEGCAESRSRTGCDTVALSGGCFQNRLLTERAQRGLEDHGFRVLVHRRVPPNDGGVSLGQAAVAAFRRRPRQERS